MYSLGVVLFEMLCGRLAFQEDSGFLGLLAERKCKEGKLDEIVFEGIKDQIAQKIIHYISKHSLSMRTTRERRETNNR